MNLQYLEVYQGENRTLTLYARDSSNNPVDLTGLNLVWRLGKPPYNPKTKVEVLEKTGTAINATAGSYSVSVVPSDTACLPPGNYLHMGMSVTEEVQFVTNSGASINFVTDSGSDIEWTNGNDAVLTSGPFHIRSHIRG